MRSQALEDIPGGRRWSGIGKGLLDFTPKPLVEGRFLAIESAYGSPHDLAGRGISAGGDAGLDPFLQFPKRDGDRAARARHPRVTGMA